MLHYDPVIVVFGTICLDRMRRVPSLPQPGGYVEVLEERFNLGGEAANTANALAIWGNPVRLCGNPIGHGANGRLLREMLAARGLEPTVAGVANPSTRTPICDIYLTPDGERTMFGLGFSQSDHEVMPERLPLEGARWFAAEPNMSRASRQATRAAQEAGLRTYLMDFLADSDPIVPGSFWQSSTDWAGFRNNGQRNLVWLRKFVERTQSFAVLSDGPNGFVAGGPDHHVRMFAPFPAPGVVDTTGAGDMFRAGMLHGLSRDWPISRCLAFASAAGCLKCATYGATTRVPSVDEIESLIAANQDVVSQYESI